MPYHWQSVGHRAFQYLFETIMGCLVPFSLISSCYSSVICRLQSAKFQRRGKGSRLILMIISAFVVFWLPYHIVNLIEVIVSIVTRHNFLPTILNCTDEKHTSLFFKVPFVKIHSHCPLFR